MKIRVIVKIVDIQNFVVHFFFWGIKKTLINVLWKKQKRLCQSKTYGRIAEIEFGQWPVM